MAWHHIPHKVPGHYNALGEIDKMTRKGSLIGQNSPMVFTIGEFFKFFLLYLIIIFYI
ncbi:MAG: hypothetical protein ACOX6X_04710 [Dethiobacteria bacterium]